MAIVFKRLEVLETLIDAGPRVAEKLNEYFSYDCYALIIEHSVH